MKDFITGKLDSNSLVLDRAELLKRLSVKGDFDVSVLDVLIKEVLDNINCSFVALKTNIKFSKKCDIIFDFGTFSSKSLRNFLQDYNTVFVFAVTLGNMVDRLINKYSKISLSKQFFVDAIASSFIESARVEVENLLTKNKVHSTSFSPGYGDLSLEIQPHLLNALNASKLINVTISKSLLMSPSKTITAIVGVYD